MACISLGICSGALAQTNPSRESSAPAQTKAQDSAAKASSASDTAASPAQAPAPNSTTAGSAPSADAMETEAAASEEPNDSQTAKGESESPPVPVKKAPAEQLKPGQKLKIAGFAEQPKTSIVDDSQSTNNSYHRAQLRVSGSMCYACLHEFQEKLKQVYGVERARVERTEQVSIQSYAPDLSNWADVVLFYDANKVEMIDLKVFIRTLGYSPYKLVDKTVDSLPSETQKKI